MLRNLLILIVVIFCATNSTAQSNGILPFTGIKYFRGGVWGKQIEVTLNGDTWISNRLPLNKDYEIKLVEPRGFIQDAQGQYHPGIKVLLLNAKKDTLGYAANILKDDGFGFDDASLKSLKVSLGFTEGVKVGDTCYQYITFFDTQGYNDLLLDFPVIITDASDSSQTTKSIYTASSTRGYNAMSCGGIELKKIECYMDSIYYPKSLYHTIRSAEMLGITTSEVNKGKYQAWIYDEKMREIPLIKSANQYAVKTFSNREEINILAQIPLDPADKKNKNYTVRYRWESTDGKKVLDIINNFLF